MADRPSLQRAETPLSLKHSVSINSPTGRTLQRSKTAPQLQVPGAATDAESDAIPQTASADGAPDATDLTACAEVDMTKEGIHGTVKMPMSLAARRKEEEAELRRMQRELMERLAKVKARRPTESFNKKNKPFLERETAVPNVLVLKYQEFLHNQQLADVERAEKDELLKLKDHNAAEWAEHGRQLVEHSAAQRRINRKTQAELERRKRQDVVAIRTREADWQARREKDRQQHEREARERVLEGRVLQAKMDAAEEAEEDRQQKQGLNQRAAVAELLSQTKQQNLDKNKKIVSRVRTETSSTVPSGFSTLARRGPEKRDDARQWKSQRDQHEAEYIQRARVNRQRAMATRASAKKALSDAVRSRKQLVARERANDVLVAKVKAEIIHSNQREVTTIYRQRFATRDSAAAWEGSPLHRLHNTAAWLVRHAHGKSQTSTADEFVTL